MKKAVILLSGGLDSAVTMYIARKRGFKPHAIVIDYGQRHRKELKFAKRLAAECGACIKLIKLDMSWKGSSLLDERERLPSGRSADDIKAPGIPSTYVPARNTIFLSIAASYAETIGSSAIFIGAHTEDSSGYPDCRPEYLKAFNKVISLGTKRGLQNKLRLEFPLISMSKSEIVKLGKSLGVPFQYTWSCYEGQGEPCGKCDSCVLRAKGFKEAGVKDPLYARPIARITDIFSSIQGEGIFVGAKQIFVRFKDCNLSCNFCDEIDSSPGRVHTPLELMKEIETLTRKKGAHHSVSLTGGEPLCHTDFLLSFLPLLRRGRMRAYLETNGTLPDELERIIDLLDIVAMDFKLPSSTGERAFWDRHMKFLKIASRKTVFVKAIITPQTTALDIRKAVSLISRVGKHIPLILQPATPAGICDKIVENRRLLEFVKIGIDNSLEQIRVIPQVHKLIGVK